MKRLLRKALSESDIRVLGSLDPHIIHEHFSLTDVDYEGEAKYIDLPGVTMVFDLAGSSASIRQDGPKNFVDQYAEIFSELTEIIYKNGGIVEKFPGDGISAHFLRWEDAEYTLHGSRTRAAKAAYNIKNYMDKNGLFREYRICMWSGEDTIATYIGKDPQHIELISIGHGVNMAHKLEKHVKNADCVIGMDYELAKIYETSFSKNNIKMGYKEMPDELRSNKDDKWYGVRDV